LEHTLRFSFYTGFWFGFADQEIEKDRHNRADDSIYNEERKIRAVGNKSADGGTDDPGEIRHNAQHAKSLRSLLLGQDVGDHCLVGRSRNIGKQPNNNSQRI